VGGNSRGSSARRIGSPLLANIYLDDLDLELARAGQQMVRYADDFVVLSRTILELEYLNLTVRPHQLESRMRE
jgi:RNA-directed DNA polymerase